MVLGGIALGAMPVVDHLIQGWLRTDLETRSRLVFYAVQDALAGLVSANADDKIDELFKRIAHDRQILALGLCAQDGRLLHSSLLWPKNRGCPALPVAGQAFTLDSQEDGPILTSAFTLSNAGKDMGQLVILQNLSLIQHRSMGMKQSMSGFLALLGVLATTCTVLVARLTLRRWMRGVHKSLSTKADGNQELALSPEIAPLVHGMRELLRELDGPQTQAEAIRIDWGPDNLRSLLQNELPDAEVLVVSNREPYVHNLHDDGSVFLQRPASGVVTALEPIMRACGGTWIAHGHGTADRMMVDEADRLQVPPDEPAYSLRRVWLSDEEYDGYYYGFANDGLWPLCHIAFVRPTFLASDWERYGEVNRKFADAVVEEARTPNPVILIQDYHFALLPKLLRERLPEATIITFWHIPWPNPEVFSICPWKEEILSGLLGSSILGFHTQFHCLNFLESVDRFLECHIDREQSIVRAGCGTTLVRPYPISIEWPPAAILEQPPVPECREMVRQSYGLDPSILLAVGVERFDYTKGIADRFRAMASLFEVHPEWIGRVTLLQIAAPTRGRLEAYRETQVQAQAVAEEINERFSRPGWNPIILVQQHHEPEEVFTLFRAADLCLVSNLVAKEFVAARDDEDGVLVLSTFAGASRELREALIVNPYDSRAMGESIHMALSMPLEQRRDRMRLMREMVGEHNVYFWAGRMLLDAARMRKRRQIELHIVEAPAVPLDDGAASHRDEDNGRKRFATG